MNMTLKWRPAKVSIAGCTLDGIDARSESKSLVIEAIGTGLAYFYCDGSEFIDGRGRTSVTHMASGYRLSPWFFSSKDARKLIEKLTPFADWKQDGENLAQIDGLKMKIDSAIRELNVKSDNIGVRAGSRCERTTRGVS